MATSVEIALASKIITQPINDLYNEGKKLFVKEFTKWRNAASREQLARKITKVQRVKTFWQRDREVSLYSFFYPSPVDFGEGIIKDIAGLAQFPTVGNFVIQGTVGQGKSIFMRHLCAQELKENGSGRIPIFIELRQVRENGLMPLIYDALDRLGFEVDESLFDFYARSSKFVLLLDGFDEIADELVSTITDDIERFCEKYDATQVIISSRPSNAIQNSRHFRIVKLSPLTRADHPKFFEKIGLSIDEAQKLLQAIQASSAEVGGLLTTPLMLTLLVVVYRAENSIPADLPEFYERLFQTLFSKHDSIKPGLARRHRSGLGERKLQQLFEAFCFSVLQHKKTTTLTNLDFSTCYLASLRLTGLDCNEDEFKFDMTRAVCLLQEEGFDIHFVHKSVLEFFAASFVRGLNNEAAQSFYSQLSGPAWRAWSQVLEFLSQIDRYRYATYYAVPNIVRALKELGVDQISEKINNIDHAFFASLGLLKVSYQESTSMGISGNRDNKFRDNLDREIFHRAFTGNYSTKILKGIDDLKLGRGDHVINSRDIVEGGMPEEFKEDLVKQISDLFNQLKKYQNYISKEIGLAEMIKI